MQTEANSTDVHDATLKIQSNGPNTMNHTDFPDTGNIGSFALYKNFTLFEIVNELVSKGEPLHFNPPTLQETLRNPNPRKEAHHIQREMQQRSTGFISNNLPISFKEVIVKTCKELWITLFLLHNQRTSSTSPSQSLNLNLNMSILQQNICWTRMITRQQKKDSTNHFIGSIIIRYIHVLKHIIR
jgi:hypothetical protein